LIFSASGGVGSPIKIPCGRCVGCRVARSKEWATRIVHETQLHDSAWFLTLTYAPEHLPATGSLDKRHLQLFWKRLRFARQARIRYFACGEYGEQLSRPHYHAIVWGVNFPDMRTWSRDQDNPLWQSAELEKLWGLGFCSIGRVTFDSAAYVARYSMKKVNGDLAEKHYERIDPSTGEVYQLEPEFACMSLRPGVGAEWLERFKADVYPCDFVVLSGGKKVPVPSYYDKKLAEQELAGYKEQRKEYARKHRANNTPRRLAVREEVLAAKLNLKKRTI